MTASSITLRATELIRDYAIEKIQKLELGPLPVQYLNVSAPGYSVMVITPDGQPPQNIIFPGDLFYKTRGVAAGMNEIFSILYSSNPPYNINIYFAGEYIETVGRGYAEFYRAPVHDYEKLSSDAVREIEKAAGYSFSSPSDMTEYHIGEGEMIILNRIPVNSLVSIKNMQDCPIALSDVELDANTGTLIMKRGNWPDERLKITANFGFDQMPDDVTEAAANKAAAGFLSDDLGVSGDVQSESGEGYSYSAGPGGKYGPVRARFESRSSSILAGKYVTGIVGS